MLFQISTKVFHIVDMYSLESLVLDLDLLHVVLYLIGIPRYCFHASFHSLANGFPSPLGRFANDATDFVRGPFDAGVKGSRRSFAKAGSISDYSGPEVSSRSALAIPESCSDSSVSQHYRVCFYISYS